MRLVVVVRDILLPFANTRRASGVGRTRTHRVIPTRLTLRTNGMALVLLDVCAKTTAPSTSTPHTAISYLWRVVVILLIFLIVLGLDWGSWVSDRTPSSGVYYYFIIIIICVCDVSAACLTPLAHAAHQTEQTYSRQTVGWLVSAVAACVKTYGCDDSTMIIIILVCSKRHHITQTQAVVGLPFCLGFVWVWLGYKSGRRIPQRRIPPLSCCWRPLPFRRTRVPIVIPGVIKSVSVCCTGMLRLLVVWITS